MAGSSSFGTATIHIELDGATGRAPSWDRQAYVVTRHIPGSDADAVQALGVGSETIALRLLLDDTEHAAFAALLATTATLTMADSDEGTCLLESIAGTERLFGGWVTLTATFRRVD